MDSNWRNRYEVAATAAQEAGQLALEYFDTDLKVEWKKDESPVTIADREAETLLRERIARSFPDDGFLGEEHGERAGSSGFRWILDPIDGTRSFVRGVPLWGTLVGVEYKGEQIAGVAVAPALGQTYRALRGDGAFRNGRRIRVSDVTELGEAHLFYSSLSWFIKAGRKDQFEELATKTERQRGFGDFYGFVLVAQGSGEVMLDCGIHAWDVAAIKPIIEEAGGKFTDWTGKPNIHSPTVIASNGLLHDAVLKVLCR